MDIREMTKKYSKKLSFEAWLKSAFIGFAVGVGVDVVYSLIAWFFGFKSILVSLAVFLVVGAIATVIFYFFRFKPTMQQVARRIDSLGLEERIITYNEFKDDDSYIAKKQREDAVNALSTANSSLMKFVISVPLAIVFGVSLVLCAGVNVFTTTSKKTGQEVWAEITGEQQAEYLIMYEVLEGGYIEGDMFQIVKHGENATPVTVVPDEGYAFLYWEEDKYASPYREMEVNVTAESLAPYLQPDGTYLITAVCYNVDYQEGGEPGDGKGQGGPQDSGAPPGPPSEGDGDGDGQGDGAGGSPDAPGNQIIDGDTFYGTDFGDYEQNAKDRTDRDHELGSDRKDAIGGYFDGINP